MPILPLPGCRAYSLTLYIAGSVCRSPVSVRPSVSVHTSVSWCLSIRRGWWPRGRQGAGAEGDVWGWRGPSLPALLVVLSQSLRVAAHLCEALGTGGRAHAHAAFLRGLHLRQNVPDLSLSQLEVQTGGGGPFVKASIDIV